MRDSHAQYRTGSVSPTAHSVPLSSGSTSRTFGVAPAACTRERLSRGLRIRRGRLQLTRGLPLGGGIAPRFLLALSEYSFKDSRSLPIASAYEAIEGPCRLPRRSCPEIRIEDRLLALASPARTTQRSRMPRPATAPAPSLRLHARDRGVRARRFAAARARRGTNQPS
jgi:hypothetical protein